MNEYVELGCGHKTYRDKYYSEKVYRGQDKVYWAQRITRTENIGHKEYRSHRISGKQIMFGNSGVKKRNGIENAVSIATTLSPRPG
jgi:hypothetical protein